MSIKWQQDQVIESKETAKGTIQAENIADFIFPIFVSREKLLDLSKT